MTTFSQFKLGRRAVQLSPKRLSFAHPVLDPLPDAPRDQDNTNGVTKWSMFENDQLSDCTCAALGHSLQVAAMNADGNAMIPDAVVLGAYQQYCGYDPTNPATDQGGIENDVLTGVEKDGFDGAKLLGWMTINPRDHEHVRRAIAYFGSVYMGASLPLSAQKQTTWTSGNPSNPDDVPGSWGGHAMIAAKYEAIGPAFVTWDMVQPATWEWWDQYVDECHVLLWDVWLAKYPMASSQDILKMMQDVAN